MTAPEPGELSEVGPPDVDEILRRLDSGDRKALDDLYPLVYAELQRVARGQLARERPDHTLNTTALVHEAYIRLTGNERIEVQGKSHFLSVAARAMRRVLVDYARRRNAKKRGDGIPPLRLDGVLQVAATRAPEIVAIDQALSRLEELDERQARVVEHRVFGGLTIAQTASVLGVSPATVKRDWTMARAWLHRELLDAASY